MGEAPWSAGFCAYTRSFFLDNQICNISSGFNNFKLLFSFFSFILHRRFVSVQVLVNERRSLKVPRAKLLWSVPASLWWNADPATTGIPSLHRPRLRRHYKVFPSFYFVRILDRGCEGQVNIKKFWKRKESAGRLLWR